MSSSYAAAAAGGAGWRPPFTASQWQELEHQALIFKYLVAGVPVPPELLVPILKSFESMTARFYHHPTSLGYCSLYGKKLDPEPWRCRRTDGKKWRCSKNAYPDSKYCERHMHRGRNRSRKPVETTTTPTTTLSQQPPPTSSPSSPSSSTVTTLAPASAGAANNITAAAAKISLPCSSSATGTGTGMIPLPSSLGQQLQIGPAGYYYQMAGGDNCRYNNLLLGVKSEEVVDEHNFLSEASAGSATGMGGGAIIEASSLDNPPWQLMPSQLHNGGGGSPPRRPQSMQDFEREASSSLCAARQQQKQQYCFFGSELDVGKAAPAMKQQQGQPLLSFFDEWPKYTRDSWSDLDQDDRSNNRTSSFSTTQLSISMPVAASSSDFSATSSRSPNGGGAEED